MMRRGPRTPAVAPCAALLLAGAASLAACGSDDSAASAQGIHEDDLPRLDLVEEVRIGSRDDPDEGFTRVGGVEVASDGSVVVLEQADLQVRVYDEQGRLLRVFGGRGNGPGEFQSPWAMGLRGDTVWVEDLGNARLTLFSLEGELLETVPADGVPAPEISSVARIVPSHPIGDGRYGSSLRAPSPGISPRDSARVPALVFDAAGEVVDTAGSHFLPGEPPTQVVVENMGVLLPPPPSPRPLRIPFGGDTVTVTRAMSTDPGSATFTIARTAPDGDTVFATDIAYRPRPIEADSFVAAVLRRNEGRVDPSAMEAEMHDRVPDLPHHPPVSDHRRGPDDALWLQREDLGGDSLRWLVVGGDGTPVGEVRVPRSAEVAWVSEDAAWLAEPDEFEVPWLVKRRVAR